MSRAIKEWSPIEDAWTYTSTKQDVLLKEYGRNVQELAQEIKDEADPEKRKELAYTIIELMRHLNPAVGNGKEDDQKLWDDLHYLANYELEVESPFPIPDIEIRRSKPRKMEYPKFTSSYRNYGENLETLVHEISAMEEEEERMGAVNYLGKLMKSFTLAWTNDFVDDKVLISQINTISRGKLTPTIEKMQEEKLLDFYVRNTNKGKRNTSSGPKKKGGRRRKNR